MLRLPSDVQPNNVHGVSRSVWRVNTLMYPHQIYFKTWDGSLNNGEPPTGGGGGSGKHSIQDETVFIEVMIRTCKECCFPEFQVGSGRHCCSNHTRFWRRVSIWNFSLREFRSYYQAESSVPVSNSRICGLRILGALQTTLQVRHALH